MNREEITIFERHQLCRLFVANVVIKGQHSHLYPNIDSHVRTCFQCPALSAPFSTLASAGGNHPSQQRLYLEILMTFRDAHTPRHFLVTPPIFMTNALTRNVLTLDVCVVMVHVLWGL